jgi:protein CpxP
VVEPASPQKLRTTFLSCSVYLYSAAQQIVPPTRSFIMKRLLSVTALLLAFGSTAAFAQMSAPDSAAPAQVQRHAPNPHKAAMRISQQLGLSPDQTAKLEPILADRQAKVQALRADTSLTDAQRKHHMKTIHQTERMQLSNVLTPDQMKQMKAMRRNQEKMAAPPTGV